MKIILLFFGAWFVSAIIRTIGNRGKAEPEAEETESEEIQPEERDIKAEKRRDALMFSIQSAEADIDFLNARIAQLDTQRDYLLLQQSGTVPGGKEHTKYQTKIINIENQVHTAENRLNKAKHAKAMAQRELAA